MNAPFFPQVSVIVPVYNGEEDLPELLAGFRNQTYPSDRLEYLIVDNGSSDRTSEILQSADLSNLKPLSQTEIQSSYAARNLGIKTAQYDILAFTDADCRPQPEWLENLVQPFAKPDIGLSIGEIIALPGNTLLEQHADRQETLSQKHTLANPFCPYGQTANLAVRHSIFDRVGLFRPYLTTGGDADICWRILRETDWKYEFVPDATVKHRHRRTLQELQKQWYRYGKSNRYLHQLHGVDLMRSLTLKETLYRMTRWVLKEVPLTSAKMLLGKADIVDLVNTPLGLYMFQARTQGQMFSELPEDARYIEPFTPNS
ncbi:MULTISPECIES: glycosyltransferase [unclassified Roseofilum]|uniref:glycosyltransferase n=1 Tax=unclassified Roseofilum TaxID=2620099 RepID=UPI000E7E7F3E|nr:MULTISPECIES: glycosyltransferase [unclassified Roseofilum]MBP0008014.1 glycosyltransferase [Roseofilum sp. Belize Diploria]MBP0033359.1 glycosyltransferase [Roseofilum sp. Belize BBD 4]HBR00305.1 glycosyltransferase [Cyanobacteria bacterium UBA11691]